MSTNTQHPVSGSSNDVLARRRAAMPIIDAAQVSLESMRRQAPSRAMWMFIWLHILRPIVVTLFWLAAVRYVWTRFFGIPDDLPIWQQVLLYALAVAFIVLVMLMLAPLRRNEVSNEEPGDFASSTLSQASEFAHLPEMELDELQHAHRLVIHHNDHGGMDKAEDTQQLLRQEFLTAPRVPSSANDDLALDPLQTPRPRRTATSVAHQPAE